jgi:glutathione peroxidase
VSTIYDFKVQSIDGQTKSMEDFKGKILLIVNVASECGLTGQYEGLQSLYASMQAQGLEVLAFPCNQFGGQEPGDAEAIKCFAKDRYQVSFPLFAKIDVNGPQADPLFVWLKEASAILAGQSESEDIEWNFSKFLINRNGKLVHRFKPQVEPADIIEYITKI